LPFKTDQDRSDWIVVWEEEVDLSIWLHILAFRVGIFFVPLTLITSVIRLISIMCFVRCIADIARVVGVRSAYA
jgi:hypothetical protein